MYKLHMHHYTQTHTNHKVLYKKGNMFMCLWLVYTVKKYSTDTNKTFKNVFIEILEKFNE